MTSPSNKSPSNKSQSLPVIDETEFAKSIKSSTYYTAMDDDNKAALNVMASQGVDKSIKFMFTDQTSGHQLSYSEMRSKYG